MKLRSIPPLAALAALAAACAAGPAPAPPTPSPVDRAQLARRVREEFVHSWKAYERLAGGHDELRPVSGTVRDWYGESLLMTPVDALDTMLFMGLDEEALRTRELIVQRLSFDRDIPVKNFEITIRLLGGLLSAYQMTGDPRLLALASDLGTRLLPAFDSPTVVAPTRTPSAVESSCVSSWASSSTSPVRPDSARRSAAESASLVAPLVAAPATRRTQCSP